jgi:hypothetical protein
MPPMLARSAAWASAKGVTDALAPAEGAMTALTLSEIIWSMQLISPEFVYCVSQ